MARELGFWDLERKELAKAEERGVKEMNNSVLANILRINSENISMFSALKWCLCWDYQFVHIDNICFYSSIGTGKFICHERGF